MQEDVVALFIPIVSMVVTGLVIWAFFLYRHKTRTKVQETIQAALDKGAELTPELIDRMAGPQPGPDRDFRRGLIAIAIGIAFALFGVTLNEPDAVRPLIAVGTFPFLVGVAYMLMWRLGQREK